MIIFISIIIGDWCHFKKVYYSKLHWSLSASDGQFQNFAEKFENSNLQSVHQTRILGWSNDCHHEDFYHDGDDHEDGEDDDSDGNDGEDGGDDDDDNEEWQMAA